MELKDSCQTSCDDERYRVRSSDHQWVDYYTMNEKQIVVMAVEYYILNI